MLVICIHITSIQSLIKIFKLIVKNRSKCKCPQEFDVYKVYDDKVTEDIIKTALPVLGLKLLH